MCNTPDKVEMAIKSLEERMEKMEARIDGNGRPGIIERLASLERAQQTQTWFLRLIISVTLTNLIGTVLATIKLFA